MHAVTWSPDSRKLAFIDQTMRIRVHDLDRKETIDVDRSPELIDHDGLERFTFAWSPDSRWLAYARQVATLKQDDSWEFRDLREDPKYAATFKGK